MLSEELLRELGGTSGNNYGDDGNDDGTENLILISKNKKVKQEKVEEKEEEVLSKRAKRKLEQLEIKRIKEEKRSKYYDILQQHSLPDEQRKLLISSRDMSSISTKTKLKRAFYLHKAGLELSSEDKELLFPEKIQSKANKDPVIFGAKGAVSMTKLEPQDEEKKAEDCSATSLGSKLLMQFKKLSAEKGVERPHHSDDDEKNDDDNEDEEEEDDYDEIGSDEEVDDEYGSSDYESEQNDHGDSLPLGEDEDGPGYQPIEVPIPVDPQGKVIVSEDLAFKAKMLFEDNLSRQEKLKYILQRDPQIQAARSELPVCGMEQEIVEAIGSHDVIILCGETGSGKSTQVPQFIYEAGYPKYGLIGVTQPRRVATISTARRVADEMGFSWKSESPTSREGEVVAYQIRHDSTTVGPKTAIKFMTDGILLKEVSTDLLLRKYSVIFLDEAHERNVNTDVLIGMLSRSIPLRRKQSEEEHQRWMSLTEEERKDYDLPIQPLRLIIMSATMRVSDFQNPVLFPRSPPVIKVEARQYPVTSHYSRRTETQNYLAEAFKKACQIHKKLPAGGILIFLTGKQEILHMCRKLSRHLNGHKKSVVTEKLLEDKLSKKNTHSSDNVGGIDEKEEEGDQWHDTNEEDMMKSFENYEISEDGSSDDDISDIDDDDDEVDDDNHQPTDIEENEESKLRKAMLAEALGLNVEKPSNPKNSVQDSAGDSKVSTKTPKPDRVYVLPLFAMLSAEQQKLVFQPPPPGHRLIVVATNVAETSITIPGIRYVVDCGRQKERIVDVNSGISKYQVTWISKASADQRQGRAGRTGAGHCYRLYSSAFFDQHMKQFQEPEICTIPLEDLILQLRSIGIENEESFPFPTPPPLASLRKAHTILSYLGALKSQSRLEKNKYLSPLESINAILNTNQKKENSMFLTPLGKLIARFPINVRLAKMLIMGYKSRALSLFLISAVVACVAERNPFIRGQGNEQKDNDSDLDENDELDDNEDKPNVHLWYHPTGDILARLRALGAFAYSRKQALEIETISKLQKKTINNGSKDSDVTFQLCEQLGLHHATMSRSLDLQKQLYQLCLNTFKTSQKKDHQISLIDFLNTQHPPDSAEELGLRQVMLTGLCDSIARKAPLGAIEISPGMSRRKRLTAYLSCDPAVTTPIYIHPNSALYNKDPAKSLPEYVIYSELISNQKEDTIYMSGLTVINASWIPELCKDCTLLHWLPPLLQPKPFYDSESDSIKCYVPSVYGVHRWELPPVIQSLQVCCDRIIEESGRNKTDILTGYRKEDEIYRWFGRLLLEGKIIPSAGLQSIFQKQNLIISISIITDMKPNKMVSSLLGVLCRDNITSITSLQTHLLQDSSYLIHEIQPFLKPEIRKLFQNEWKLYAATVRS